jgi:DNA-directed RNA polymerase specialized sigma24 family protein
MAAPSAAEWPENPEELARLAADASLPDDRRDQALRALEPLIRAVAERVARGLRGQQIQQDLCDEALAHVGMRFGQFDPEQATPLEGWLRKVLYNLGAELRRRRRRRDPLNQALPASFLAESWPANPESGPGAGTGPGDAEARLDQWVSGVREQLDRLHALPRRGVDYLAVLLVLARLRMAGRVRRSYPQGEAPRGEVAQLVAALVPWRADEERLCFRDGCLAIGPLWHEIVPLFDAGLGGAHGLDIPRAMVEKLGAEPPVSLTLWNQWTKRARTHARQLLGQDTWDNVFATWL